MEGMYPWGGFGANPTPHHVGSAWNARKNILAGGWPYSEGIYEDMDKVFFGQFYWNPDRSAAETVSEYAAFEFSPAVAADVVKIVNILEDNLGHEQQEPDARTTSMPAREKPLSWPNESMQNDGRGPTKLAWRILYLRALIDKELREKQGRLEGKVLSTAFDELTRIYHAQHADPAVRPPVVN